LAVFAVASRHVFLSALFDGVWFKETPKKKNRTKQRMNILINNFMPYPPNRKIGSSKTKKKGLYRWNDIHHLSF